MRVIAGEFRGRQLLPPAGDTTRPITDRVKQSLFDILAPIIPGANVYDCFAGTGSMGLECLSRGAERATFFEADRSAGQLLKKNINALQVADRAVIVPSDLFAWFRTREKPMRPVELIFLDPPYRFLRERPDDLRQLAANMMRHLAPEGTIIFRHDSDDQLALSPLIVEDVRTYGSMTLEFLKLPPPAV
jgi:16S rRNA (guanine(966)-N(2))-methyltransferase RsmD